MDRLRSGATAATSEPTAIIGGATAATVRTKPTIKRAEKPQDLTKHIHTILKNPDRYSGLPVCDPASVEHYSTQNNQEILDFSKAVFDQFSKDRSGATLGENSAILFPAENGIIPEGWSGVRIVYKTHNDGQQGAYLLWENNASATETNAYAFGKGRTAYQQDEILDLPLMKDFSLVTSDLIAEAFHKMQQCPIDPHAIYGPTRLEAGAPIPPVTVVAAEGTYESVKRSAALEGDVAASSTRLDISTLGDITTFLTRAEYTIHATEIDDVILESEWSESGHSTGTLIREEQDSYTFLFITEVEEVDPEGDDGDTISIMQPHEIAITFSGDSFHTQGERFKSLNDAALYLAQQNGLDLAVVKDEAIYGSREDEAIYGTGDATGSSSWKKYDVPTDLVIQTVEVVDQEAVIRSLEERAKALSTNTSSEENPEVREAASLIRLHHQTKILPAHLKTLVMRYDIDLATATKLNFSMLSTIDVPQFIKFLESKGPTSSTMNEDLRAFLKSEPKVPAGGPLGGVTVARAAKGTGSRSSGSNESSDSQSRSRGLLGRLFSRSSQPAQVAVKDSAAEIDFDSQVYGAAVAPKMLEENIVPQGQTINYMKQLQAGQCFVGVGSDGSHYLYKQGQKITIGNNIEIAHIKAGMKVHGLTQLMQWTGNQLTPLK